MPTRLLILETHHKTLKSGKLTTSGVDYVRLILAGKELAKLPDFKVEIRKDPFTKKEKNWNQLTKNWDIIWTSYIDEPIGYVQMAFWAEKNNCKVVIDLDDNVWQLPETNPVYPSYHPGSEKLDILSKIIENQEHITVSTLPLKYVVVKMCGKPHACVRQLPNMIDLTSYDYNKIVKKDHPLTITHFGSTTHYQDLLDPAFMGGLTRVLKKYPEARFITVGNWIPQFQQLFGPQYRQIMGLGKPDVFEWINESWPKLMGITDVVVAPLSKHESNQSKSDIKLLETGAAKIPFIGTRMKPYDNTIGMFEEIAYLAHSEQEWFEKLDKLLSDEKLRKERGERLYSWVSEKRTIQGNIEHWAEYFKNVTSRKVV